MSKLTRFIAGLLAIALAVVLAACSSPASQPHKLTCPTGWMPIQKGTPTETCQPIYEVDIRNKTTGEFCGIQQPQVGHMITNDQVTTTLEGDLSCADPSQPANSYWLGVLVNGGYQLIYDQLPANGRFSITSDPTGIPFNLVILRATPDDTPKMAALRGQGVFPALPQGGGVTVVDTLTYAPKG